MNELISIEEARSLYAAGDAAHDFDHVMRVTLLADQIATAEQADRTVVHLAALLHDLPTVADETGDHRAAHHLHAAARARQLLLERGATETLVAQVEHCIEAHRYRDRTAQPQTLEARCLYDADKLDSIGAIGVARAFAYAGAHGGRLWTKPVAAIEDAENVRSTPDYTPVHEYVFKLRGLLATLHTPTARMIGERRHAVMAAFFAQLDAETLGAMSDLPPGSPDASRPFLHAFNALQMETSLESGANPTQRSDSVQWLHVVLDAVRAGLWQWEIQSGDVFWSPESYRLLGLQPEQTRPSYAVWRQAIHPDDRNAVDAAVQRAVDEHTDLLDLEFRVVLPGGEVRWMKDRGKLVLDESGQPVRMIGIQIDITEQKQIAASLEHERILLRTVIDALPLALYVKDTEARKVLTNITDLMFLDEPEPNKVLGKTDYDLFPDESGQTCYSEDLEVLHTGKPVLQRETEFTNQSGTRRQILLSKTPLRNRDQKIIGLVGITEDITELKRLETQLWESRRLEALGALASNIGHDFNNLLTPIIGLSEVLYTDAAPGSRERQYLGRLLTAAYKAKDLLNQMRVFSRLHKAEVQTVNLLATVAEACDIQSALLPPTIQLNMTFAVSSAMIEADPTQLHQMIMNLLVNAYQAIEDKPGKIAVIVKPLAAAAGEPPHGVTLEVTDNGQGIDEATVGRIFEPFFTTKRGSGSGLGLAIVHGVVQNLGGTISVESQPEQGAAFTVHLPNVKVTP